jgi:signal transduction histidine kinase
LQRKMSRREQSEAVGVLAGEVVDDSGAASGSSTTGAPPNDLQALSAEVVDLLYAQAFTPAEAHAESDICKAFSDLLLRHYDLCCIVTFLRDEDGRLREHSIHTHPHLDKEKTLRVGRLLASVVERTEHECQVWLDREEESDCEEEVREARRALAEANLKAGITVPIHARGGVVGAVVALSSTPDVLRAALKGVRFVAPPIIIAVGYARRAGAMGEQRARIGRLIEELQERRAALEEANLELRRVNRYRSLFLARMSHELRTPLTSVLGFAEILLEQEHLTDAQRRFCEKIQDSGRQLKSSLTQLVDLSRLEAGQTEIFLHEFSLRETLRESVAAVGRLAEKQKVTLECGGAPAANTIVSDEGKLRQVLYNFLAHAIGRSPVGGRVRVRAESIPDARFRIEIADEGEPLLDPSSVFEPSDFDAPNERGTNMNELGLVIANRLLGVLGGTVKLDPATPRGLAVRLEFPACPA